MLRRPIETTPLTGKVRSTLHRLGALDRVIDDVEPTENPVQNHPQNRVVDAPRESDSNDRAEPPAANASGLLML